ncbi:flagellar motor control protein ZomB [Nocardia sp. BMG111209]|uniref:flagellar motor control protein ZomB n=1 Tax=Nocardia sp. BMG111209 TaxID=1160137 RepID=UPI00036A904D|nr:flagellar motor control protein ZomB [Nocardia sp. BMG111209]
MVVEGQENEGGPAAGAAGPATRAQRRSALVSRTVFVGGVVLTAVLFALGAWQRRWIADDGLIVLRTVRNLLAGYGPVFNEGERVETNTSAAWTYVIWFFAWITHARLEYVSLAVALSLSVLAIVLAMLGAARLWGRPWTTPQRAGTPVLLLPAGAAVYIAVPPARDYATSGLENCLVICWLGLLWWLLIRWSRTERASTGLMLTIAFVAGLSWLIRPEMIIVGGLAGLLIFLAPMPASRLKPIVLRCAILVAGCLVPGLYQIFRMGYYGLPYPNTAVAKEAGGAKWGQGFTYLWDLTGPYLLWLPVLLLLVAAVLSRRPARVRPAAGTAAESARPTGLGPRAARMWQRRDRLRTPAVVVALVLVAGLALVVFELRVGGDFMHGRMLLPQLFCLLLPVAVLPVRVPVRRSAAPAESDGRPAAKPAGRAATWLAAGTAVVWLAVVGWSVFVTDSTGNNSGANISSTGIVDERIYYVLNSSHQHPVLAEDYLDYPRMRAMVQDIAATPDGGLLLSSPSYMMWYVAPPPLPIPDGGAGHTVYFLNLGMTSMNVPLDVRVIDQEGLAYPLAAHTDRLSDGRIGHDKNLYSDWVIVDAGAVGQHPWMPWFLDEKWVKQARTALTCPDTQALLASSRGPLTASRFRHNVEQALHFAKYRIDRVPKYEIQRCGLVDPTTPVAPN